MELHLLQEAAERKAAGESIRGIARSYGVAESTLRSRLKSFEREPHDGLSSEPEGPEEIPVIVRDYSDHDHHYIYPLGDVHKGSPKHHLARWREWLGYLAGQDNRSMLGMGDFFNSAIVGSVSDVYEETNTVGNLKRELRDELLPLTDKIDGMCPGNHEARIWRAVGDCPVRDVCDFLNVPYFKSASLFVYRVGDMEYEVYVRHGTGNGQSLTALSKGVMTIQADVYITGHTHRQAVAADDYFARAGDRCVRRHRYFINSGSFIGLEAYALERGYAPTRIGAPRIFLDGRRKDVHASL